jgi:predicted phage replisome organizer/uncharacterized phage protein (TIGR02220 family)
MESGEAALAAYYAGDCLSMIENNESLDFFYPKKDGKITTNIFDNRKIKQIERLPEGDSLIVIWVKILCLAGNINDSGLIYLTKDIPYTEELLATEFNRDINTVRLALQTFERFGMIEIVNNVICVSNWERYQNVEGLDKVREQARIRKQKQRERQKIALLDESCHVTSRDSHATEEEKEEEREVEKNNIVSKETMSSILDYLNEKTGRKYKATSKATVKHINARFAEGYTEEDFKKVIDNKTAEWLHNPKMQAYLRPDTLFGTKFDSYLNQQIVTPSIEINPKQREGMVDVIEW